MKKILSFVVLLALIFSLAIFATPSAFADGTETASEVEKHPLSEHIKAGESTKYTAYPRKGIEYSIYWTIEDKDGNVIKAEEAPNYYPGVTITFPNKQKICLFNVPAEMNGTKIQAHFVRQNAETIHTDYADLIVDENPNYNPTATISKKIVITKHPYDEVNLTNGQKATYFLAYADNYSKVSWEFKIGTEGVPFSAADAVKNYGLSLDGLDTEQLWVYNISWGINGWLVRAVFQDEDGNVAYTNWASMLLVNTCTPCKPASSCKPSCTPCKPSEGPCVAPSPCKPCTPPPCVPSGSTNPALIKPDSPSTVIVVPSPCTGIATYPCVPPEHSFCHPGCP